VRRETWLENRAGSVSTSRASSIVVTMYQPGSAIAWTGARSRSKARVANGNCWKSSTKGSSSGSSVDGDTTPFTLYSSFAIGGQDLDQAAPDEPGAAVYACGPSPPRTPAVLAVLTIAPDPFSAARTFGVICIDQCTSVSMY
jgi:hypothetical protein